MLRTTLVIAVTTIVASACSGAPGGGNTRAPSSPTSRASLSSPPATAMGDLSCEAAVATNVKPPRGYEQILGVVALPTADSARRALQAHRDDGAAGLGYFAKTGLVVRAGSAFDVRLKEDPDRALIGWGDASAYASAISTTGCAGQGWIAFAGGFWVKEPGCLRLRVQSHGLQRLVRVGVGAPCQGQRPAIRWGG